MPERLRLAALLGVRAARIRLGANAPPDLRTLPPSEWLQHLRQVDSDVLVRSAIRMFRFVFLPRWIEVHPTERRPQRALEAAEQCFKRPSADALRHALEMAEACADVQVDAVGATHRIARCARAVACAAAHPTQEMRLAALTEVFQTAEEELVTTAAAFGFPRREAESRAQILDALHEILLPEEGK